MVIRDIDCVAVLSTMMYMVRVVLAAGLLTMLATCKVDATSPRVKRVVVGMWKACRRMCRVEHASDVEVDAFMSLHI